MEHSPDIIVLWESWITKTSIMIDKRYELHRTPDAVHHGVGILARKDMITKTYINDEPYIIAVQLNSKESIFVIGVYMK